MSGHHAIEMIAKSYHVTVLKELIIKNLNGIFPWVLVRGYTKRQSGINQTEEVQGKGHGKGESENLEGFRPQGNCNEM
jgi:hypothetical protein